MYLFNTKINPVLARGTDPGALDLGALQTFAFSPQSAATSTAIGLGYVRF